MSAGSVQMTLNLYILGFSLGQLVYGPLADSFGRKPVIALGSFLFAIAAAACALAQTIFICSTLSICLFLYASRPVVAPSA